ncbi:cyclic nucleotide-binding domain-containing protein [Clostridium tarantellae]|uniref:Cyclic nucleotide-binding domain-containing protein n=1 Tax=Clostridium tarantellae TaxID=39493 RepID=A0A6I1MYF8_9CLOT|nr:cyclic nucleotide-binding domain-containing protein [Clostridium tarantellae]
MVKILHKTSLFKNLNEFEIKEILNNEIYKIKEYSKGEIIANQGEKCTSLSIVINGKASVQTIYKDGKILTLANFQCSDIFAEALLFSKNKEYPSTVIALEKCKILSFPKNSILHIMKENKIFSENILQLLSEKIILLNKKINIIELDSIRRKICKTLLDNYKKSHNKIYNITSKKELAEELGIPRPSLSRELIKMKNLNLIDFNLKEIKIVNLKDIENEFYNV